MNKKEIIRPETLDGLLRLVAWYYTSKEITLAELKDFMASIGIEDPDPDHVMEVYRRYCDSVHDTGLEMARKLNKAK